jgi:hypothetical protein
MNRMIKYAAAAGIAGALAIGMSAPSQAAHGRNAAAAIGFGAGALVGAAAASAANNSYYGPDYGYGGPYAYAPGYAYGPDYGPRYGAYAYAPNAVPGDAYAYAPAGPGWSAPSCATQGTYGKGLDYANCH